MTSKICLGKRIFSVPKKNLGSRCGETVECRDGNALCLDNACKCSETFHDQNGVCSKFTKQRVF